MLYRFYGSKYPLINLKTWRTQALGFLMCLSGLSAISISIFAISSHRAITGVGLGARRGNLASTSGTHVPVLMSDWPCQSPLPEAASLAYNNRVYQRGQEGKQEGGGVSRGQEHGEDALWKPGSREASTNGINCVSQKRQRHKCISDLSCQSALLP